jgi:hypothetical protein
LFHYAPRWHWRPEHLGYIVIPAYISYLAGTHPFTVGLRWVNARLEQQTHDAYITHCGG